MTTISAEDMKLLMQAAEAGLLKKLPAGRERHVSMTGRLSMKRTDMVKLIRACGGVWDEHPNFYTGYLIVGDTSIHGRTQKMREAERSGTTIIAESDFIRMITP